MLFRESMTLDSTDEVNLKCNVCDKSTIQTQRKYISYLPETLLILMGRFNKKNSKIATAVKIPLILQLLQHDAEVLLHLEAIICHVGDSLETGI